MINLTNIIYGYTDCIYAANYLIQTKSKHHMYYFYTEHILSKDQSHSAFKMKTYC